MFSNRKAVQWDEVPVNKHAVRVRFCTKCRIEAPQEAKLPGIAQDILRRSRIMAVRALPWGKIRSVRYDPIIDPSKHSFVTVTNSDLFRDKKPVKDGLYDSAMGTIEYDYLCKTCQKGHSECPGHFGSMLLEYPVIGPSWYQQVKQWAKCTCPWCGSCMIPLSKLEGVPRVNRLARAATLSVSSASGGNESKAYKLCPNCHRAHPKIKDEKNNKQNITATFFDGNKTITVPLPVHILDEHFSRISDETVEMLAPNKHHHPRYYIWNRLLISPVSIRQDSAMTSGSGDNTNPELTTWYIMLMRKNASLHRASQVLSLFRSITFAMIAENPNVLAEYDIIRKDTLSFNILVYGALIGWSANSNSNSLRVEIGSSSLKYSVASQLPNKRGLIRRDMMGVRTIGFRDIIFGDSSAKLDTLTIPYYLANNIQIYEVMQSYNEDIIRMTVRNGRKIYPGCKEIIRKNGSRFVVTEGVNTVINYGDAVMRDMMDKDRIYFNRQPSLTDTSLTSFKTRVNRNSENHAVGMNPSICGIFNADFDGDAMQGGGVTTALARAEIRYLIGASQRFISSQYSTPVYGFIQDAIVGIFFTTRSRTKIHKAKAMQLYSTSDAFPNLSEDRVYTGRELVSAIMPPGINYINTPSCAAEKNRGLYPFHANELKVVIENGVMKSGILDVSSIKAGASNSLFQAVNREYGADYTLGFIFQLQQLAGLYCDMYGLTLSPVDYYVTDNVRELINRKTASYLAKAGEINKRLVEGKITSPFNMTISEKYESMMIAALGFDYYSEILMGVNPDSNLLSMVISGSRGTMANIEYMIAPRRQVLLFGKRPERQYSYGRTLPYTQRYSLDPLDNGFVMGSFFGGISLKEYVFNTFEDRNSLIIKALSTAETGMHSRLLIKNLESMIINHYRLVVKDTNIVQYVYGLNNYSTSAVEYVVIGHVEMSDAAFDDKFKPGSGADGVFYQEYSRIAEDRAKYRDIWIGIETLSLTPVFSNRVQVPMPIDNLAYKYRRHDNKECSKEELIEMVKRIQWWCDEHLPYVLFNNEYERASGYVPEYLKKSLFYTTIHVREKLHSSVIAKMLTPESLDIILDIYFVLIKACLVAPGTACGVLAAQCDAEPATQQNLHAVHGAKAGGSTKVGMERSREILSVNDVKKTKNTMMVLEFAPELKDPELALSFIEESKFQLFTTKREIFFEDYHKPTHPQYVHEIGEWMKVWDGINHSINPPPSHLSKFCFRFEISRELLIVKYANIGEIVASLSRAFPTIYATFTNENYKSKTNDLAVPILRIYTSDAIKDKAGAKKLMNSLLNHNIRGIAGVIAAQITERPMRVIKPDGTLAIESKKVITTYGTNLSEVMRYKAIDPQRIQSDSPPEIMRIFGIEAARTKLINELTVLISPKLNLAHIILIADEMCMSGEITKIARRGLDNREQNNVLLRMSNQSAYQVLKDAAFRGSKNNIYGVSAPLILGLVPQIGTNYSEIVIKNDAVREDAATNKMLGESPSSLIAAF